MYHRPNNLTTWGILKPLFWEVKIGLRANKSQSSASEAMKTILMPTDGKRIALKIKCLIIDLSYYIIIYNCNIYIVTSKHTYLHQLIIMCTQCWEHFNI